MKSLILLLTTLFAACAVFAQQEVPPPPQTPPQQQNYIQQNWFPQSIEDLGQYATSRTEFSFDRSMLVLASKEDPDDQGLRRVIAGIDGISVHRFHFQGPGAYDPRVLSAVRHDYSMAGWQHISKAHEKYGYPSGADLWLRLEHNTIRNIAVLYASANQVNFFSVSGSISPIDLLHLAGHFGIPRIEGGVSVPYPANGAPAPMAPGTN
ncbi:MAG TPA: hypothetical protein VF133_11505 [Terriglobales bacterium]